MRVLMLTWEYPPHVVGGMGKHVMDLAPALAACVAHAPVSRTVNTRVVARDNLTHRQRNRRLTRRTNGFANDLIGFEKPQWRSLADDQWVVPHQRLPIPLGRPDPTRGTGSLRTWRARTPAMAAGITDHGWTTTELLA